MKSYVLSMAGSGATSEIYAADDEEAIEQARTILTAQYGDEVVECDHWDSDGENDDGKPCKRLLWWADEESSIDDPGVAAIAELSTTGRA